MQTYGRRKFEMDWIYRFNESIEYMEQHLANEIDYGELGKIACCSTYHYQRMFTYMAGIPLSEYILSLIHI